MLDLRCGDCLEVMKEIGDNSVDAIICDLPYFQIIEDDFDNQWNTEYQYIEWCSKIFKQYDRILKDNSSLFIFSSRQLNRKICYELDKFFNEKRIIIWVRKRNFNNTRGHALSSEYEPICYYTKGIPTFNILKIKQNTTRKEYVTGFLRDGINLSDVWSDIPALPHNSTEKTEHPTQKPIKLIERIIKICTNENDLILDNCMGSGTTGVACVNTNRSFIGIEKDPKYFEIAKDRIQKASCIQEKLESYKEEW